MLKGHGVLISLIAVLGACDGFMRTAGYAHVRRAALPRARAFALGSTPSPGDRSLLEAVGALKAGSPVAASELVRNAREAYRLGGGPSESQLRLLEEVAARVQRAIVAAQVPPPAAPLETARSVPGDKILQEALSLFNAKEYSLAREAIARARASFASEGPHVANSREVAVGNLFSLVAREEERMERVAQLLKLKKLTQLKEAKRRGQPGL